MPADCLGAQGSPFSDCILFSRRSDRPHECLSLYSWGYQELHKQGPFAAARHRKSLDVILGGLIWSLTLAQCH